LEGRNTLPPLPPSRRLLVLWAVRIAVGRPARALRLAGWPWRVTQRRRRVAEKGACDDQHRRQLPGASTHSTHPLSQSRGSAQPYSSLQRLQADRLWAPWRGGRPTDCSQEVGPYRVPGRYRPQSAGRLHTSAAKAASPPPVHGASVKSPHQSWIRDSSGGPENCFPNMAGPPCCRRLRARR
jgi:hypothetical protein